MENQERSHCSLAGLMSTAAFNLIPIRPLDGSIAWALLPALFRHRPTRPVKREPAWRSWR